MLRNISIVVIGCGKRKININNRKNNINLKGMQLMNFINRDL